MSDAFREGYDRIDWGTKSPPLAALGHISVYERKCATPGCERLTYSTIGGPVQCGYCVREVMRRIFKR